MRINSIPPKELLNQYTKVREKAAVESPEPAVDKAELTGDARTFSAALKAAREAVETRTPEELNRVAEVTKKIAEGTYSVSGEDVARKILGQ